MTGPRHLGIIPARGGSRRIPRKNLQLLAGRPLIAWTVEAARGARHLHAVRVSTDDRDIADCATQLGVEVGPLRPPALARDDSPVTDTLRHELALYEAGYGPVDAVVLLQPTSPFRGARDIDEAIALFESSGADTITAVRHAHEHPYWAWRREGAGITPYYTLREVTMGRGALPDALMETGALYVIKRELVIHGLLYGRLIVPYLMEGRASLDIDTPDDLAWAEFVLARDAGG